MRISDWSSDVCSSDLKVDPAAIDRTAILCIEGGLDDISGVGRTKAALDLTPNLPKSKKHYHLQQNVGHYGLFNGGKWRREIAPVLEKFIRKTDVEGDRKSTSMNSST